MFEWFSTRVDIGNVSCKFCCAKRANLLRQPCSLHRHANFWHTHSHCNSLNLNLQFRAWFSLPSTLDWKMKCSISPLGTIYFSRTSNSFQLEDYRQVKVRFLKPAGGLVMLYTDQSLIQSLTPQTIWSMRVKRKAFEEWKSFPFSSVMKLNIMR